MGRKLYVGNLHTAGEQDLQDSSPHGQVESVRYADTVTAGRAVRVCRWPPMPTQKAITELHDKALGPHADGQRGAPAPERPGGGGDRVAGRRPGGRRESCW
jgi:hypothetical protein